MPQPVLFPTPMSGRPAHRWFPAAALLIAASASSATAQSWSGYSKDAQHSSIGQAAQTPQQVYWAADIDVPKVGSGGDVYAITGSPVVTRSNHVVFSAMDPTGHTKNFTVHAVNPTKGSPTPIWSFTSDYLLPYYTDSNGSHPGYNWTPSYGITLTPKDARVVMPGAGGTLWVMDNPDRVGGTTPYQVAFYDDANLSLYEAHKAAFQANVFICTPITSDASGNLFFGYVVLDNSGLGIGLKSGLARVALPRITDQPFKSSWISATAATAAAPGGTLSNGVYGPDTSILKVAYNCAPAVSPDGTTVYVGVNRSSFGNNAYTTGGLVALNSATLAPKAYVRCKDPVNTSGDSVVDDDGTSSPTVGPDGDVYFGVLESSFSATTTAAGSCITAPTSRRSRSPAPSAGTTLRRSSPPRPCPPTPGRRPTCS